MDCQRVGRRGGSRFINHISHSSRPIQRSTDVSTAEFRSVTVASANRGAGKAGVYSLHTGVTTKSASERTFPGYILYQLFSSAREVWSLTKNAQVHDELKTAYRDGTAHVLFELLDVSARVVALIPNGKADV